MQSPKSEKRLFQLLQEHRKYGALPMHMPGHKRNCSAPYLQALGASLDITEINGFDNLHSACGILQEAMDRAAHRWGSRKSYFLVGGSTCGILAGIYAAIERGERILMARNCHRSVYNAVELTGASPVYLTPQWDPNWGLQGPITPEQVKAAIAENPDVGLVVLTSPTYDGILSEVAEIADVVHAAGIPLLVDEAHGAHLDLSPYFTGGAVKGGADLVVQSLHKTLPSLTQTAIAHVCTDRIDMRRFSDALAIFETSSPSYLLLASIDECLHYMDESAFEMWNAAIEENRSAFSSLAKLCVLGYGDTVPLPSWRRDSSKLLVSTNFSDLTGPELAALLRRQYNIEVEMAAGGYVLAMTGPGDTGETIGAFAKALCEIDRSCKTSTPCPCPAPPVPERICGIYAAKRGRHSIVERRQALGKISGEYIYAYPPGIPLVVPGERLDRDVLAYLDALASQGVALHSDMEDAPGHFSVLSPI